MRSPRLLTAAALALALPLTACTDRPGPATATATATAPTSAATPAGRTVDALDLAVGECFLDLDGDTRALTVVECAAPHHGEAIGVFPLPQAALPSGDAYTWQDLRAVLLPGCASAAGTYELDSMTVPAGVTRTEYFPGDRASWAERPRVVCAYLGERRRTGSVRGDVARFTPEQLRFLTAELPAATALRQLDTDHPGDRAWLGLAVAGYRTMADELDRDGWSEAVQTEMTALVVELRSWSGRLEAAHRIVDPTLREEAARAAFSPLTDLRLATVRRALGLPSVQSP
ncbi:hypothetical protein [Kitasatospora sp. NPDC004289]